jgi:hypothetical protein
LHHDPTDEPAAEAYPNTHRAYWDRYGQPDPSIWPIGGYLGDVPGAGAGCFSGA